MSIKIALVGNPNCGKTTLFNILTNDNQRVGNWSGVTVEQKTNKFCQNENIDIIDLPGLYSLNPFTPDEKVSSDFLENNKPDAIINVVSANNLERSLYLTLQILDLKIPTIIAVTMIDNFKKNGGQIDFNKFSEIFKCDVVPVFKNDKPGCLSIIEKLTKAISSKKSKQNFPCYSEPIETCLNELNNTLKLSYPKPMAELRALAIKILENDDELQIYTEKLNETQRLKIKNSIQVLNNNLNNKTNPQTLLINERYNLINHNIDKILVRNKLNKVSISDKIDNILTNKWLAIPAFIFIISAIYFISIPLVGKPISEWLDKVVLKTWLIPNLHNILSKLSVQFWLKSIICNGIVAGVGSVLVFVPQLFLLFFMLCFLEECGYMSRITFITDKIFNGFGLCGQSIISFLVSSSCGVNGIMATKTIRNNSTRLITIATTTFIPCSAKIPIIASISSLFLTNSWLIAPIAYLVCFLAIFLCSIFLKKKKMQTHQNNNFFMEILPYQLPSFKHLFFDTLSNVKSFISKATTMVLVASVLVWVATNVGFSRGSFHLVQTQTNESILAQIGKILIPVFKPLGFSNWQTISASISGLFAKENIVNTLEVIAASSAGQIGSISSLFHSQAAAISFLIFNLLCAPCCVAIVAVFKQTNSIKLTLKIALFQTITAWCFSAATFFIARILI